MKDFFKMMFASMVGVFLLIVVLFFISAGIVAALIASASSEETILQENTILQLRLNKTINDRGSDMNFSMNFAGNTKIAGLNDILKNIEKASCDSNIKGIYLNLSGIPAGISTVSEIRDALLEFKKSGKFIWAYSEVYSQKAYYLASVADSIFLNPQGAIDFKGVSTEMAFIKGTLEKLDVKMQIVRHGKYKSAAEPLFLEKMSQENREQISGILTDIWDVLLTGISETRKINRDDLNRIADSLKIETADDALKYGLVDKLVYKDELIALLKQKSGLDTKNNLRMVTMDDYQSVADPKLVSKVKDKIAVIYATGSIGGGDGDNESIGSEKMSRTIRQAREDDKIKAIVFRINSGGGDALASDVIWREIELASKVKPVVASFGDVAGSGGYYIGCAASKILADPTTITGSIGVFGVIPNMEGLFNKKLGITFDWAMTNKNGDFINVMKPLPPYHEMLLQRQVDHIYDVFTDRVSAGRKMAKDRVDSVGQGRIWSGSDAREMGLIDEFGGLTKAITMAAELAKLKEYRTIELPAQKEWFEELIQQISGSDPSASVKEYLGSDYRFYQYYRDLKEMKGVQARMLTEITIE